MSGSLINFYVPTQKPKKTKKKSLTGYESKGGPKK